MPKFQAIAPADSAVHSPFPNADQAGGTLPAGFAAFHQSEDSDVLKSAIGYGSAPVIFVDSGGDLAVLAGVLAARAAGLNRLLCLFSDAAPGSDMSSADLVAALAQPAGELEQLALIVSERVRTAGADRLSIDAGEGQR